MSQDSALSLGLFRFLRSGWVLPSPFLLQSSPSHLHPISLPPGMGASPLRRLRGAIGTGVWGLAFLGFDQHVFGSMSSHQRLSDPSEPDSFVGDPSCHQPGPPPKTDQIVQEIGKLIPLVNDSFQPISRPSSAAPTGNLASHLTWDDNGELAID